MYLKGKNGQTQKRGILGAISSYNKVLVTGRMVQKPSSTLKADGSNQATWIIKQMDVTSQDKQSSGIWEFFVTKNLEILNSY